MTLKNIYTAIQKVMPWVFFALLLEVTHLLLMEMPPKPAAYPFQDKVHHITVFVALMASGGLAFMSKIRAIAIGLLVYGALMEVLQTLLTVTREGSVYDWIADGAGVALGFFLLKCFLIPFCLQLNANSPPD